MTEKKPARAPKRKLSKAAIVLIVDCCIIGIPLLVYGGILLSAQLQTGTPIFGDRFDGDLDPAISDENIRNLETEISSMSGVESVDIELTSAQFRINVDTDDNMSVDRIESLVDGIYTRVNQELPINTYFTSSDGKKMYDLAISGYNFIDSDNEDMNYVLLTKNGNMTSPQKQVVSEPLDSELAAELRGETPSPTTTAEPTETPSAE